MDYNAMKTYKFMAIAIGFAIAIGLIISKVAS